MWFCTICNQNVPARLALAHCREHAPPAEAAAAAARGTAVEAKENPYTRLFCRHCGKGFVPTTKKYLVAHERVCGPAMDLGLGGATGTGAGMGCVSILARRMAGNEASI